MRTVMAEMKIDLIGHLLPIDSYSLQLHNIFGR